MISGLGGANRALFCSFEKVSSLVCGLFKSRNWSESCRRVPSNFPGPHSPRRTAARPLRHKKTCSKLFRSGFSLLFLRVCACESGGRVGLGSDGRTVGRTDAENPHRWKLESGAQPVRSSTSGLTIWSRS